MRTKIAKCVSISALLLAVVCWNSALTFQIAVNVVVFMAATIVVVQAFRAKKYSWAAGFLVIALLFNPAVLVVQLSGAVSFLLVLIALAAFTFSLAALKPQPLLSIPSITGRNPGSQSL